LIFGEIFPKSIVIGRIHREKEEIPIGNFWVTVNEMDGNRIREYIVCRKTAKAPEKKTLPT
jgi:CBS domain containing-hemolysin-like protein